MAQYKVYVPEIIYYTYLIEADDEKEALHKAIKYESGDDPEENGDYGETDYGSTDLLWDHCWEIYTEQGQQILVLGNKGEIDVDDPNFDILEFRVL